MMLLTAKQQEKEEQGIINSKTQYKQFDKEVWQRIKELINVQSKSKKDIHELKTALNRYPYFQSLLIFISSIFSCFDFLSSFIKLFEEMNDIDEMRQCKERDLVIRVSDCEYVHQMTDQTFLDEYNWKYIFKKYKHSCQDSTQASSSSQSMTQISSNQCMDSCSDDLLYSSGSHTNISYIIIRNDHFQKEVIQYLNNKNSIFSNIAKCIPSVSQITSSKMQDNIVKNVEIVNLIEGTVINDSDMQCNCSPRLRYSQKNIHPSAIWFVISGNGLIERRISESTKISISILSESSLFGEEILFNNYSNTTQDQNYLNQDLTNSTTFQTSAKAQMNNLQQKNSSPINEEQTQLNNPTFERFSLKLKGKISTLYYIPIDKFVSILPQIIIEDVKNSFIDKMNSRQYILKQKLLKLTTQKHSDENNQGKDSSQKVVIKRKQNEVSLMTNQLHTQRQLSIEDANQKILLRNSISKGLSENIQKKQEILAYQLEQHKKRQQTQPQSSSLERLIQPNEQSDNLSQRNIISNSKIRISNILLKRNSELKQEQVYNNEEQMVKQQQDDKIEIKQNINDTQSKRSSSQQNTQIDKIPVEKKHLERKIAEVMNKGFDFGYDTTKADVKRDTSIRILQIKKGIFNPSVNVIHPNIVQKKEKEILKQQQKIQSTSIIQGLDSHQLFTLNDQSTSSSQHMLNQLTPATARKRTNNSIILNTADSKPAFYLTSKNAFSTSIKDLSSNFCLSNSFKNTQRSSINININNNNNNNNNNINNTNNYNSIQQSFTDKSTHRGSDLTPSSKTNFIRPSTSLQRMSESYVLSKYQEDQFVGPFTLNQQQNTEQKQITQQSSYNQNFSSCSLSHRDTAHINFSNSSSNSYNLQQMFQNQQKISSYQQFISQNNLFNSQNTQNTSSNLQNYQLNQSNNNNQLNQQNQQTILQNQQNNKQNQQSINQSQQQHQINNEQSNQQNNNQSQQDKVQNSKQTQQYHSYNFSQSLQQLENKWDADQNISFEEETSYFGNRIQMMNACINQNNAHNINSQNQSHSQNNNNNFYSQRANSMHVAEDNTINKTRRVSTYEYKEQPQLFSKRSRSQNLIKKSLQQNVTPQILNTKRQQKQPKQQVLSQNQIQSKNILDNSQSPRRDFNSFKVLPSDRDSANISQILFNNKQTRSFNSQNFVSVGNLDRKEIETKRDNENLNTLNYIRVCQKINADTGIYNNTSIIENNHFQSNNNNNQGLDNNSFQQDNQLNKILLQNEKGNKRNSSNVSSPKNNFIKIEENESQFDLMGQKIFFKYKQRKKSLQEENNSICEERCEVEQKNVLLSTSANERKSTSIQQIRQNNINLSSSKYKRNLRRSDSLKVVPKLAQTSNTYQALGHLLQPSLTQREYNKGYNSINQDNPVNQDIAQQSDNLQNKSNSGGSQWIDNSQQPKIIKKLIKQTSDNSIENLSIQLQNQLFEQSQAGSLLKSNNLQQNQQEEGDYDLSDKCNNKQQQQQMNKIKNRNEDDDEMNNQITFGMKMMPFQKKKGEQRWSNQGMKNLLRNNLQANTTNRQYHSIPTQIQQIQSNTSRDNHKYNQQNKPFDKFNFNLYLRQKSRDNQNIKKLNNFQTKETSPNQTEQQFASNFNSFNKLVNMKNTNQINNNIN